MNKTFTWRLLTPGELTDVYLQEMRRDFPAGELKPLSMILTSEAEGLAHTWGVFDGETLAAYLLMVRHTGYYEHLIDAWFRILVLPCPGAPELSDKDALDALVSCYKRTISESQWRKYVQFYAPDGSLRL